MIAAVLLAAAVPTAIDAERGFARDAQAIGQWQAFQKWAAPDAVMFVPQPVWAQELLKGRTQSGLALSWWPTSSVISCDGGVAVNSGPYVVPNNDGQGRFTTIWLRGASGWRWVYEGGQRLLKPIPADQAPIIERASCAGHPNGAPITGSRSLGNPAIDEKPASAGSGESRDRTLAWDWATGTDGTRRLRVFLWSGSSYRLAVDQLVLPRPE